MMIAVTNQKGGVGKSTTAVGFAVLLFDQGFRVALLDADNQRSSSQWIAEAEPQITVRTVSSAKECRSEAQRLAISHDFVVADGPGGLGDMTCTLLESADLALIPVTPSALDIRSVQPAISELEEAQKKNGGPPEGWLILNKIRRRDTISRELETVAPNLGVRVAKTAIRDLAMFREAAQQGTVVTRMGRKGADAAKDFGELFQEIMAPHVRRIAKQIAENQNPRRVENG
jgi:chromosome partitioning protein